MERLWIEKLAFRYDRHEENKICLDEAHVLSSNGNVCFAYL